MILHDWVRVNDCKATRELGPMLLLSTQHNYKSVVVGYKPLCGHYRWFASKVQLVPG
jgi:hypothetical protein